MRFVVKNLPGHQSNYLKTDTAHKSYRDLRNWLVCQRFRQCKNDFTDGGNFGPIWKVCKIPFMIFSTIFFPMLVQRFVYCGILMMQKWKCIEQTRTSDHKLDGLIAPTILPTMSWSTTLGDRHKLLRWSTGIFLKINIVRKCKITFKNQTFDMITTDILPTRP